MPDSQPQLAPVAISALLGTLLGLGGWAGLARLAGRMTLTPRHWIMILFVAGLGCRLAFAWLTPTFYAPDEQSHYNYIRFVRDHRALPVQTHRTGAPTNDWEYYQPPLYYLLLAPVTGAASFLTSDDFFLVRLCRLVSVLLWAVTFFAAVGFFNRLRSVEPTVKIVALGFVALLPTYVFLSSVINNDNLLIALGSVFLVALVREPASLAGAVWPGLCLGLAFLTKLSAVVYLPLALLVPWRRVGSGKRGCLFHAGLILLVAGVLAAPLAWWNWTTYGSLTAEAVANVPHSWAGPGEAILETMTLMLNSFWSVSGVYNDIGYLYPVLGWGLLYVALVGFAYGHYRQSGRIGLILGEDRRLFLAMTAAIAINLILVFRFGLLYHQGQGRFLFPLLVPIAWHLAVGWRGFFGAEPPRFAVHAVGAMLTYAVSFLAYSVAMFPVAVP